jgi:ABC-type branched-subunit amino acid transport system substrate-binding protein
MRRIVLLALCSLAAAWTAPQDAKAPPAARTPNYGGTPDELKPFRRVANVVWRYFESPLEFRGPGREEAAPADLKSFKLGLFAPVEGKGDVDIGHEIFQGVTLALDEANAAGGFHGVPFELVVRNDAATWGDSSSTIVDLSARQKVWAILGSVDGASTHVAIRVALKLEIPVVNTASTDPTMTETFIPWLLRCYPDDRQYGYRLARLVFEEERLTNVAMIRSNDRYGRMGVKEFSDASRRLGHPMLMEQRYAPGQASFDEQLARVRELGVEGVVVWGPARDCGRIVARMRELGMPQRVFGNDRMATPNFVAAAGAAAEGVLVTAPYDPNSTAPAWTSFRERYRKQFGETPGGFAAYAYDGTRILLAAIGRAGANRARIRDELAATHTFDGVTETLAFDPTMNNLGHLHVLRFHDGAFARLPDR